MAADTSIDQGRKAEIARDFINKWLQGAEDEMKENKGEEPRAGTWLASAKATKVEEPIETSAAPGEACCPALFFFCPPPGGRYLGIGARHRFRPLFFLCDFWVSIYKWIGLTLA